MVENKVYEFSVRKTNILITCPHCTKQHYLAVALVDKDKGLHRGGSQSKYEKIVKTK